MHSELKIDVPDNLGTTDVYSPVLLVINEKKVMYISLITDYLFSYWIFDNFSNFYHQILKIWIIWMLCISFNVSYISMLKK